MSTSTPTCACEPCDCSIAADAAIEKDGKLFCSQPCADGHAGGDQCCTSCECC